MKKLCIAVALIVVAVLCWNQLELSVSLTKPTAAANRPGMST